MIIISSRILILTKHNDIRSFLQSLRLNVKYKRERHKKIKKHQNVAIKATYRNGFIMLQYITQFLDSKKYTKEIQIYTY